MPRAKTTTLNLLPIVACSALLLCFAGFVKTAQAEELLRIGHVEKEVAERLELMNAGNMVEANIIQRYQRGIQHRDVPVDFDIEDLDYNSRSMRWEANLVLMQNDKVIQTHKIAGRYETHIEIPVLRKRLHGADVIEEADIEWITYPDHRLRKDTALTLDELVGKSPRRVISEHRPIRLDEIQAPIVMKKGTLVQVLFKTPSMEIRTVGQAMSNGAIGDMVEIKNSDSNIVLQATVGGPTMAFVNQRSFGPASVASLR